MKSSWIQSMHGFSRCGEKAREAQLEQGKQKIEKIIQYKTVLIGNYSEAVYFPFWHIFPSLQTQINKAEGTLRDVQLKLLSTIPRLKPYSFRHTVFYVQLLLIVVIDVTVSSCAALCLFLTGVDTRRWDFSCLSLTIVTPLWRGFLTVQYSVYKLADMVKVRY